MILYGKKVILRAVEREDIEMLRELSNDPEFEKMVVGWSFPISKKDQEEWFQSCNLNQNTVRFIIETKADGAVGMIGLRDIDWKNGVASGGGMRIAKKDLRTKGIATDAWMTQLRYAFEELRLNRVNGSALEYNEASLRVCEKVGFKVEGIQREAVYKNGKYHNVVQLGVLKADYEAVVEANGYWS